MNATWKPQYDYTFTKVNKDGHVEVEWLVKDFPLQPDEENRYLYSPKFVIYGLDAVWKIQLSLYNPRRPFSLHLVKQPSQHAINVLFVMGVKRADGTTLKEFHRTKVFAKDGDKCGEYGFLDWEQVMAMKDLESRSPFQTPENRIMLFCHIFVQQLCPETNVAASKQTVVSKAGSCPSEQGVLPQIISNECAKVLSENFKNLCNSGCIHDVTIKVKDRSFAAHRNILGSQSSVFRAMFEHNLEEKENGEINIEDCDPDSFQDFLLFVYGGDPDVVSKSNAIDLYMMADKYDLPQLKDVCIRCLSSDDIPTDLILDIVPFATVYNESDLLQYATALFVINATEILGSEKWQAFKSEYFDIAAELLQKSTSSSNCN